ncbi:MAG TPA: C-GCAxxG-C-C family protein [Anaerolineae bacterium]|nr:C-GCAxxG-C-C family protein [Anaerolineae bacterium]HPL27644.1 C-GCAxxG-C-C family protein [Anaerolineae bacterium]
MPDYGALQARVQELAERDWDIAAIEARVNKLVAEGLPRKALDRGEAAAHAQQILDRVQRRAEEYNLVARNCARSTALAVMEEFGLGTMEIVQALSPFPGFGGTGWMCGGVTGGLIALGLFFGSEDVLDQEAVGATMMAARRFMARFEEQVGAVVCPTIHEDVVFGRYMDPGAGPGNMEAFAAAQGFQKCGLLPGIGARIAAEIVLESLHK